MAFDVLNLTRAEQMSAVYVAFLGRGGDPGGRDFWLSEYDLGVQTGKTEEQTLNDISESFRLSDEADGLFPVLETPAGASQSDVVGVINKFFNNMFGRDVQGSVDEEATELGE